jgi:hypothetical protein
VNTTKGEKKMFKKMFVTTLALILAIPVIGSAMDMTGKYGMGYFNSEIPVGGRYWFAPKMGFDLGVGFDMQDQGTQSYTDFYVGAGFNYVLISTDKANFFARPGVVYGSLDARPYGIASESKWTKVKFSLMPVAEVFFNDHFSLQAGHGFELELVSYPDEAAFGDLSGESRTNFKTLDGSISYLGFQFYFK